MLDRLDGPNPPKLIVVDPRKSETASRATVHLAPKIGTNVALLNGLQRLLFHNEWVDETYISQHVVGVEELRKTVEKYSPEHVEEITGVPPSQLMEAARILGTTRSLLSTALQGVYQSNQATASACQINNINLLRGKMGKAGSGILQMNGQPTAQNNRETGCDGEYPGFRNFQNHTHMQEIADHWNIDYIKMPHWNQPTHIENMLTFIANGSIEMFWISGTNPLVSLPNLPKVRNLLTKPNLFVVCQDIFLTETAAIADVVLPAAQWGEKTGCFTNADRTMHLSLKAVDPPGESRSDLDIFIDFAKRMDFKDKNGNPLISFNSSEEVFEAWKRMSFGRPCDCSELTYERLHGGSGIQWPCNKEHPFGKERLFDDGIFFTDIDYCESFGHDMETGSPLSKQQYKALNPAGRAILKRAHYKPSFEEPDEEYPLRLSTGRNVLHFHTRTKTGRSKRLEEADSEPWVRVSSADAEALQLSDGEIVMVKSRRGAVELPVTVGNITGGQVFIPFHFGYWDIKHDRARAANELTIGTSFLLFSRRQTANHGTEQWDPVSKQPFFKSGAVRIEKCVQREGQETQAKEQQTAAIDSVKMRKKHTTSITSDSNKNSAPRVRRLDLWIGATHEAMEMLMDIYEHLIPRLIHDYDVQSGLFVMHRIAADATKQLKPQVEKYHESQQYAHSVASTLRHAMFPRETSQKDPYEALVALQSLQLFLTYIDSHLLALLPASQALWDTEFVQAVTFAQDAISRQKSWASQHIKVKGPQTLLVPMAMPEELYSPESGLSRAFRC